MSTILANAALGRLGQKQEIGPGGNADYTLGRRPLYLLLDCDVFSWISEGLVVKTSYCPGFSFRYFLHCWRALGAKCSVTSLVEAIALDGRLPSSSSERGFSQRAIPGRRNAYKRPRAENGIDVAHQALQLPAAASGLSSVVIATPTETHAALARQAFAAGKHVYLEKPIASTLDDGCRVVEAWRESGKIGMIGFNYRHRPDYEKARRLVSQGLLGQIKLVDVRFTTRAGQAAGWRAQGCPGGGVLLDLASHEFDLVHYVLGEPVERILATAVKGDDEGESVQIQATTSSGIGVHGFFSSETIDDARMEVIGTTGKLTIDRYGAVSIDRRGVSARGPFGRWLAAFGQLRHLRRLRGQRRVPWNESSFRVALTRLSPELFTRPNPGPISGQVGQACVS